MTTRGTPVDTPTPADLAACPLPRRIAVVRGATETVFVDGQPVAAGESVELRLVVSPDADAVLPAGAVPTLECHSAFSLLMPEYQPGPEASHVDIARAWFQGCAATFAGRGSLRLAHDILPDDAGAERQLLHDAAERAGRLQQRPSAHLDVATRFTGPLHTAGWQERDGHELLDACWDFLRATAQPTLEERPGQIDMSHAVLDALHADRPLMVEAGTGTGKTLAYALPAVLVAAQRDKRLVLSTHTRNLQQQLAARDLPWLWEQLGLASVLRSPDHHGLEFAKLLGRTNYVCRQSLLRWVERQRGKPGARLAAQVILALLRSPDGALEDVLPDLPAHVWQEIHSRRGLCVGRRCKGDNPCPVYHVRDAARSADILVVNHALLMADARGGGGILGEWHGLVVDEAHHLQAVATEALGHRLGAHPIEALSRPLAQLEREARSLADDEGGRWGARLTQWCVTQRQIQKKVNAWWRQLDAALPQRARVPARQRYLDGDEVFGCIGEATLNLQSELDAATRDGLQALESLQDVIVEQPQWGEALELFGVSVELHLEVATAFSFLLRGDDEDWTFYLDFSGADNALEEIVALPLDVSESLPDLLHFEAVGAVFTSATLFVDDDASWFRRRLGIASSATSRSVASPFDHQAQCLLAQTAQLGDWRDPDFAVQVAELVSALHQRTGRRTMVLLTSRTALRALDGMLRDMLPASVTVLSQLEAVSRSRLAQRFTTTPGAVLLGLASFWEGVDFPRDALELLIIPKLPFLVPNEPLVEARCQRMRAQGDEPFTEFILPEAVLRLRQGFGRLLRTPEDRGAVVLLDARLETREYGAEFLQPLPVPTRTFQNADSLVQAVADWVGGPPPVVSDAEPEDDLDLFTLPGDKEWRP